MRFKKTMGIILLTGVSLLMALASSKAKEATDFPQGTATPSEVCGECHKAIYQEFAFGFGSDIEYKDMTLKSSKDKRLTLPANVSAKATAHAFAGVDPFPIHARGSEEEGRSCNVCHFPEAFALPDMENLEIAKPKPRPKGMETGGLTCASCHLTPDGKIRGPYQVNAPHPTVVESKMQTAEICAYCHSLGKRVEGKQTQSFLEWREDFHKKGLGKQHCQDCHMPRTMRKSVEDFEGPVRAIARHLWTGGRSKQRLSSALSLVAVQKEKEKADFAFHVINIGAGHSVPTGSNRRGLYLIAEVLNKTGKIVADREWLFAPWYGNRPDDRAFLEEDKKRPDAMAATQADAQGPHENIILAGEERLLTWAPNLKPGNYTVRARLIYDLNRYNSRSFKEDQTEINRASLSIVVKAKK
jgi:nitrate/TMAO reductase-like tetraheme cytochrome c subunit